MHKHTGPISVQIPLSWKWEVSYKSVISLEEPFYYHEDYPKGFLE